VERPAAESSGEFEECGQVHVARFQVDRRGGVGCWNDGDDHYVIPGSEFGDNSGDGPKVAYNPYNGAR
jgi:hypothetical protein